LPDIFNRTREASVREPLEAIASRKDKLMSRVTTACFLACALACSATIASAGTLANGVGVYQGIWSGTTSFQGVDPDNGNAPTDLTGYVEWAVYAPGTFPGSFSGFAAPANEFVYAYQAFVTGAAPLSSLSIDLLNPAGNIGTFTGNGVSGDPASFSFLIPFNSANWLFDGVAQGGTTVGLAYSSPFIPMLLSGTVINHGSAASVIPVPSPDSLPIPEPSSLALAVIGWVALCFHIGRRRGGRAA
jgi:hypothetical protein